MVPPSPHRWSIMLICRQRMFAPASVGCAFFSYGSVARAWLFDMAVKGSTDPPWLVFSRWSMALLTQHGGFIKTLLPSGVPPPISIPVSRALLRDQRLSLMQAYSRHTTLLRRQRRALARRNGVIDNNKTSLQELPSGLGLDRIL